MSATQALKQIINRIGPCDEVGLDGAQARCTCFCARCTLRRTVSGQGACEGATTVNKGANTYTHACEHTRWVARMAPTHLPTARPSLGPCKIHAADVSRTTAARCPDGAAVDSAPSCGPGVFQLHISAQASIAIGVLHRHVCLPLRSLPRRAVIGPHARGARATLALPRRRPWPPRPCPTRSGASRTATVRAAGMRHATSGVAPQRAKRTHSHVERATARPVHSRAWRT